MALTLGPGQLFTSLLHQIENASTRTVQQQLARQLAEVNRTVAELAAAIEQSATAGPPYPAAEYTSVPPEPDQADAAPLHAQVIEPTID